MDNITKPEFTINDIQKSYLNIFNLESSECQIVGLKLVGNSEQNQSNMPVYQFIAIIKADAGMPDICPTENQITQLRNAKHDGLSGPEISYKIKWKDKKKGKVASFQVRGQITHSNVMSWEIHEGFYYIQAELFGNFG